MTKKLLVAALATVSPLALAAPVTFNLTGTGTNLPSVTVTSGTQNLTVTAYSSTNTSGSGLFQASTINQWGSNGWGIKAPGETTTSPNHAADNAGKDEVFLLDFGVAVDLLSFGIGWAQEGSTYGRADVDIWVGGPLGSISMLSACYSGCANSLSSLGFTQYHFEDMAAYSTKLESGTITGRYVVIGAESPAWDIVGYDWKGLPKYGALNDYFKLKSVSIEPKEPPNETPEPSVLLLMALGLLGFGALRRRSN